MLTVRLRNLKISGNPEYDLGELILSHLHIPNLQELEERFPRAVFLLDGFDELCMKVKGACDCENMLAQLCGQLPGDCKIILTSRPKYIQVDQLSKAFPFSLISLQHFSRKKREEWLNQYRALVPDDSSAVDEEVAQYILSIDDNSVSNLCDTPMTLYLLIGGKVTIELTQNEWALYRYIFADAVVNTPYAEQLGGALHPLGEDIGNLLYWIAEEIAYKMYCAGEAPEDQDTIRTKDGQFLVTGETVTKIIEELLKDEPFQKAAVKAGLKDANSFDLQRIHALCCYWRSGPADGPVEFYHNNIRDFFLCEKIRREFNGLYQQGGTDEEKTDRMAQRLVILFKYGEINETVCHFLRAYTRDAVSRQEQKAFPLREKEHPLLPMLYQKLLTQGRLYDNLEMDDHIRAIRSILLSTGLVYRHLYQQILEKGERIHWWNNVNAANQSGMMQFIFKSYVGKIGFRSDLSGADLSGAYLFRADLIGADLSRADLRGADLREADLIGAVFHGADLTRANMNGADLSGEDLRGANLRMANLSWAILRGADLSEADLSGVNFYGTVLLGAKLPDGFRSYCQDE
ncbi:MAG: pentapeptide repeat-containing protein [Oscillospiraceae bacterium]|nr:pentapeptide repeat-containing protein [Oscillospiraceae bacterium]